jgi:hypothetical protein
MEVDQLILRRLGRTPAMANPKDDPAFRLSVDRDLAFERMCEAMDMEDERLLAGGWNGKDSKDEKRLMELLGDEDDEDDDLPF